MMGVGDVQLGEEYLARQKAWDDLDSETRGVKREIGKVGIMPISERIYQSHYQLEQAEPITEEDFEPLEVKEPRVKFDHQPVGGYKEEKKSPKKSPKRHKVTMDELEKAERERKDRERAEKERKDRERAEREKQQRLDSERERKRKEALDREKRQKEDQERKAKKLKDEQDRKERERKAKEDAKVTTASATQPMSTSVKNPFAKKMGGPKKLDPISQPQSNMGIYNAQSNVQRLPSSGVDDLIQDNYELDFGDDKKKDSIEEDISNEYSSGFVEEDPNEEFIF